MSYYLSAYNYNILGHKYVICDVLQTCGNDTSQVIIQNGLNHGFFVVDKVMLLF